MAGRAGPLPRQPALAVATSATSRTDNCPADQSPGYAFPGELEVNDLHPEWRDGQDSGGGRQTSSPVRERRTPRERLRMVRLSIVMR